jgi:Family of unknown function (DUF6518)
VLAGLVIGAFWGALSAFTNSLDSPVSLIVNAGWAWAGVAVLAGRLAGTLPAGAAAGAGSLIATTTAYYLLDAVLRDESVGLYQAEMLYWWLAAIVVGPVLGVIGVTSRRPGALGLLARLTVPVGAIVEMLWQPRTPSSELVRVAGMDWVRPITCAVAAIAIGVLIVAYVRRSRIPTAAIGLC